MPHPISTKADVYAFDEPSAFIDVEDRLKVAEVIREFMIKNETENPLAFQGFFCLNERKLKKEYVRKSQKRTRCCG